MLRVSFGVMSAIGCFFRAKLTSATYSIVPPPTERRHTRPGRLDGEGQRFFDRRKAIALGRRSLLRAIAAIDRVHRAEAHRRWVDGFHGCHVCWSTGIDGGIEGARVVDRLFGKRARPSPQVEGDRGEHETEKKRGDHLHARGPTYASEIDARGFACSGTLGLGLRGRM